MRGILTPRIHGVLDYLEAALLIVAPYVLRFGDVSGSAVLLPVILGIGLLAISLLTAYPLGLLKLIPFRVHLLLDVALGLVLLVAALVFRAYPNIWVTLAVIGVLTLGAAALTRTSDGT